MKLISLETIIRALGDENARYLIVGGLSLEYRPAVPVSTEDFAAAEIRRSWIREKRMVVFPLHSHRHPETPIDLFVAEPFDFDQEYDKAMIGEVLPGLNARFVSIETLIRMKESSGRERDWEDVRQLKLLMEDQDDAESS